MMTHKPLHMTALGGRDMAEKIYLELGVRIARLRMRSGMSQSQVASMLHIAQTTYSNYESGSHKIPLEQLQQLVLFYRVSYDDLLGSPAEDGGFDEQTMISKLSRLNASGKNKVMEYIEDISAIDKYTQGFDHKT